MIGAKTSVVGGTALFSLDGCLSSGVKVEKLVTPSLYWLTFTAIRLASDLVLR